MSGSDVTGGGGVPVPSGGGVGGGSATSGGSASGVSTDQRPRCVSSGSPFARLVTAF